MNIVQKIVGRALFGPEVVDQISMDKLMQPGYNVIPVKETAPVVTYMPSTDYTIDGLPTKGGNNVSVIKALLTDDEKLNKLKDGMPSEPIQDDFADPVQFSILEPKQIVESRMNAPKESVEDDKMKIALTFNDEPTEYTSRLLDILRVCKCKATIFTNGDKVAGHTEILKRAYNEGHEIGIQSYNSEVVFTELSSYGITNEIVNAKGALEAIEIIPSELVRPPKGKIYASTTQSIGAPIGLWDIDTTKLETPYQIKAQIQRDVTDGSVLLLDGSKLATHEALLDLIPELVSKGYEFVTASDLYKANKIELTPGKVYAHAHPNTPKAA